MFLKSPLIMSSINIFCFLSLKKGLSYSLSLREASNDSARFIKFKICEKALVILKVCLGGSFLISFDIFEKILLLFLSNKVFLDNNLNLSTIL